MNAARRYDAPRWLGYLISAIALVGLVLAMAHTPLIEWSNGDYILGVALAAMVVGFFVASFRNRLNLLGNMKGRSSQVLSIVGAVGSGFFLGANIINDDWTVINILTSAGFAALAIMFIVGIAISTEKIRNGD
jgi:peptidoglycan/LPS O-acetylase OafA/YrhL